MSLALMLVRLHRLLRKAVMSCAFNKVWEPITAGYTHHKESLFIRRNEITSE
jgi:hypothetical protein